MIVLVGHIGQTLPTGVTDSFIFKLIPDSLLGVRVFFVISGYLITRLLLVERGKTGEINLKHFYIRRIFRIFPIFYIYILTLILLKVFVLPDIVHNSLLFLFAGLFIWNYKQFFYADPQPDNGNWFLGHFWTLAMEEQFYLLWPLLFKLTKNISRLKRILVVIIIAMPFIRVLSYIISPGTRGEIGIMLHSSGDIILIGCLGAIIEHSENFKTRVLKYIQNKYLITCAIVFLLVVSPLLSSRFRGAYDLLFGISLNSFCILAIIFWCIYAESFFAKVLNTAVFIQIGILSYSLYIWQQLFLTYRYGFWVNKFPQNLIIVFVVGSLSYYLIERPFLKLKRRFTDVKPSLFEGSADKKIGDRQPASPR